MIVPMKKLTVLCMTPDRERTLNALGRLGVVHVSYLAVPEGADIERARQEIARVQRVVKELGPAAAAQPTGRPPQETIDSVWSVVLRRRMLVQNLNELRKERERIAPFGSFDPESVTELSRHGIHVGLYTGRPQDLVDIPEDALRIDLHQDRRTVFFAVIRNGPLDIDATRVKLPAVSLEEADRQIRSLRAEIEEQTCITRQFRGDYRLVSSHVTLLEDRLGMLEARTSMGKSGPISYLRGYFPADQDAAVRDAARRNGWGLLMEDPRPGENAPTLIRNPKWVRPIQVIFDFINIVPGYNEADISACFLLFFSLFFAMIVGDAGYGALFLLFTAIGWRFLPKAPRVLWHLLLAMSLCTIAWGLLSGSVFGMERLPALLAAGKIHWLDDQSNMMLLCFLIGAIHLTIAHAWNAIRYLNSPRALAQVGWICTTWGMFFAARTMVLGQPFPAAMVWVMGAGALLIVTCMTPPARLKSEWFNHVMFPLNLINNFVDVVSYVRLFAVGMATFAMASAFNGMAGDMAGGWVAGIGAALVLFIGHTLNILLATMGVLVHGIRLNTLEFSGHMGLEWSGTKYKPFASKAGTE